MSALLNALPGDIPGLLRKWSPVLVTIDSDKPPIRGVVLDPIIEPDEPDLRCLVWNEPNGRDNKAAMFVRLNLTDPTGRAHAAWWCDERWAAGASKEDAIADDVLVRARYGTDVTRTQIDTLARLVLRLAGRTP